MDLNVRVELEKCEQAISSAKMLLSRHPYPMDLRTVMVIGFIDQAIEHHAAVLLLIRSGLVGSAFALARSVFEGLFRGVWILLCATDTEVKEFENKDKLPLKMFEMAAAIDQKTGLAFFADFVDRAGKH